MKFKIPNENRKECFESLCEWLENRPEPFHITDILLKRSLNYLGHYVSMEEDFFQVYDLYEYKGSKFYGTKFIARFGNNPADYLSEDVDNLKKLSNKELKTFALGEAYRRSLKRKKCNGFHHFF